MVRCYRVKTKCIRATLLAILVEVGGVAEWIPNKAILPSSQVKGLLDEGELIIRPWLARKKGWVS
jgi:hypothetical protein